MAAAVEISKILMSAVLDGKKPPNWISFSASLCREPLHMYKRQQRLECTTIYFPLSQLVFYHRHSMILEMFHFSFPPNKPRVISIIVMSMRVFSTHHCIGFAAEHSTDDQHRAQRRKRKREEGSKESTPLTDGEDDWQKRNRSQKCRASEDIEHRTSLFYFRIIAICCRS